MNELNLESILQQLNVLNEKSLPIWGNLTAQEMVEHLTDILNMSNGTNPSKEILIPLDKIESMQRFLVSDKEMKPNIKVPFAPEKRTIRNPEIALAIDEFVEAFLKFESHFELNQDKREIHPYYGALNYIQWQKMHQKHIYHHFKQFEILKKS